jgi:light-independent protochlorophyllide reductase subunit B
MELTVWTYEGPPHVGAMRVANSMRDVHFVLHAPQGDTYADLLFTMIERNKKRPPVTYTTFQARDLSGDTAEIFKTAARDAVARFKPQALLVGASCTAELIQDDPGGLAKTLGLNVPVVPLEMPSYQKKENWGAAETFYRLVRAFAGGAGKPETAPEQASCNILGPTSLGFRNRDDIVEVVRLVESLGCPGQHSCAAGRFARRSGPDPASPFQHRALSGNRRYDGPLAQAPVRPGDGDNRPDRRRCDT